ncbi:MAG: aminotransferase class V-fold PLP-dependent enzyme [Pseudomonadota bacterium]
MEVSFSMSLARGFQFLSIPGPSMVPDRVLRAMHRPSPNIYEGELPDLTATIASDLKSLAKTSQDVAIYIGNGHAAWEAAVANTLTLGDEVLVLGTGRFGPAWGDLARNCGVTVYDVDFGMQSPVDPNQLEALLRADTTGRIKAVLTVQSDTASSVQNHIPALRDAIDAAQHPALFMVDAVCSFGCEPMHMDDWGVDVLVSGSQKGLMTPAGLGFVFFSAAAAKARANMERVSSYWDWTPRAHPELFYRYFCGTAPTHHLYGLREALNMLIEEGIENVWDRHHVFAQTVWAALDTWGDGFEVNHNITDRAQRSWAVSAVRLPPHQGGKLRQWSEHEAGCTLGIGLGLSDLNGPRGDDVFRIGHMGWLNVPMILGTLGTVDAGFKSLGIPHGSGAIEAATAKLAELQASKAPAEHAAE